VLLQKDFWLLLCLHCFATWPQGWWFGACWTWPANLKPKSHRISPISNHSELAWPTCSRHAGSFLAIQSPWEWNFIRFNGTISGCRSHEDVSNTRSTEIETETFAYYNNGFMGQKDSGWRWPGQPTGAADDYCLQVIESACLLGVWTEKSFGLRTWKKTPSNSSANLFCSWWSKHDLVVLMDSFISGTPSNILNHWSISQSTRVEQAQHLGIGMVGRGAHVYAHVGAAKVFFCARIRMGG